MEPHPPHAAAFANVEGAADPSGPRPGDTAVDLSVDLASERPAGHAESLRPDPSTRWLGGAMAAGMVVLLTIVAAVRAGDDDDAPAVPVLRAELGAPLQSALAELERDRAAAIAAARAHANDRPVARVARRPRTGKPGLAPSPSPSAGATKPAPTRKPADLRTLPAPVIDDAAPQPREAGAAADAPGIALPSVDAPEPDEALPAGPPSSS